MKTISFVVEIDVEDHINDDNEYNEMSEKIAKALVEECRNGEGLTPEASETFTKGIYVRHWYTNKQYIEHP
jgi:hypothetical protein